MTFANEGDSDRGIRLVAGAAMVGLGWSGVLPVTLGIVGFVVGAIVSATGIIGWCPGHTVFGFSTRKVATGYCLHCDAGRRS